MPLLRLLLNILWSVTGGVWMAALWLLTAVIMVITIVGIPWARAAFNIALYTLLPFGLDGSQPRRLYRMGTYRDGPLGTIGNLMWLVLAGWWLAFAHFIIAPALAIKVIGLPFAWAQTAGCSGEIGCARSAKRAGQFVTAF